MNHAKIFRIILLSFISGILWGSFWQLPQEIMYIGIFSILMFLIIWYKKKAMKIAFFIAAFFFGIFLVNQKIISFNNLKLVESFSDIGEIVKIDEKENSKQIILKSNSLSGKILINTSLLKNYQVGDQVKISCLLEFPKNKEESILDYRMYLAKEGIGYICKKPDLELINHSNNIFAIASRIRTKGEEIIEKLISEPEAGLAKGILLGGSDLLYKDVADNFSRTGLTHVVAVSGYNVTIVAQYLIYLGILLGFWRKQAITFAILGIVVFIFLVGFSASAVRAAVMASILLWAMRNGRICDSGTAIIFSAAIMLLINPLLLRWDVGFQLSFLATLGIVLFANQLQDILQQRKIPKFFAEIVAVTITAQILVLPILIYNFGKISTLSLLANILVLPVIPISMLLVLLIIIFGIINTSLGLPFAWLAYLILHAVVWAVQKISEVPWAQVSIEINAKIFVLLNVLLFGIIIVIKKQLIIKENEK